MEGVHSYEQRSSSSDDHNGANFNQNRIIIADRRADTTKSTSFKLNSSFEYGSNEWKTSKYTLINFLPKNLFEQFRRLANFYFLITAILQIVIPFSPVGPITSLLPLLFVISTTAFKQAYEDYLRHKVDKEVNNRLCHILKDKKLIKIRSKDIKVGDFVYVKNNEEIPCDMILLATSGLGDRCYVTTANLDGETSLKSRTCFNIKEKLGSINELDEKLLLVECEKPNATLYEFNAYLRATTTTSLKYNNRLNNNSEKLDSSTTSFKLHSSSSIVNSIFDKSIGKSKLLETKRLSDRKESDANKLFKHLNTDSNNDIQLDISNLLLRAARLKNTSFIYGLAIYTGRDTKLALNSHVKANKFSSIEKRVNLFLFIAFAILAIFTLTSTVRYTSLSYRSFDKLNKNDSFEKILVSHFLLYNYLIPISLYVTLEFIKFFSTTSVVEDKKMQVEVWQSINVDKSTASSTTTTTTTNPLIDSHSITTTTTATTRNHHHQLNAIKSLTIEHKLNSKTSVTSMKRTRVIVSPKCNSSDLNEELGQVEVLFSDKTGTLTENKMKFRACSIQGSLYRSIMGRLYLQPFNSNIIPNIAKKLSSISSHRYTQLGSQFNQSIYSKKTTSPVSTTNKSNHSSIYGSHYNNKLSDHHHNHHHHHHGEKVPQVDKLKSIDNLDEREDLAKFFTCLCLCSTITLNETLPLKDCLPDKTNYEYNFQSASPDEESLISAAQLFGLTMCKSNEQECFIVIERTTTTNNNKSISSNKSTKLTKREKFKALVETKNSNDKYLVRHFNRLMVLEFDSVRKRMSVIYRDCDNDCLIIVSKGSEEMLDCIDMNNLNHDLNYENCINTTMAHFDSFSKSGLRTLLIGWRYLSDFEFNKISNEMKEAKLSTQDKDYQTNKLYHQIERNMKLIGTTAVEDTLQEGVPETIENLRSAGIKIWLLTGDKVETAISVAYLCKLLDNEMVLFHLVRQQDFQKCKELILFYNNKLKDMKKNEQNNNNSKFALVADGRSFHYAMKYAKQEFKQLSKQCSCVLGCRLSPLQKAEVVELIKNSDEKPITLAIGDGANDVSMIQEAHVGIGVFGKEGRQAVNSSDFAIGRFNLLNRLLFVHGHLFYHRTSNTIHYFFYKNLIFILPQFLYSFYNLSSATTLYHPILLITFNLLFTSLPILSYGLYEVYIPETILECFPKLYKINRNTNQLRISVFICWLLLATLQALIGFYLLYYIRGSHSPFLESGKMAGINGFSLILYFVIVLTVTIKLYLITRSNSIYFILTAIISCLSLPVFFLIYSLFDWSEFVADNSFYGQFTVFIRSPMFWIAIITTTFATILPDIFWFVKSTINYFKILADVMNEKVVK